MENKIKSKIEELEKHLIETRNQINLHSQQLDMLTKEEMATSGAISVLKQLSSENSESNLDKQDN